MSVQGRGRPPAPGWRTGAQTTARRPPGTRSRLPQARHDGRLRVRGAVAVAALLAGVAAAGCTAGHGRRAAASTTRPPSQATSRHPGTIVALLADNQLLSAAADRGVTIARLRLGPAPNLLGVSHAMALSPDTRTLFVLAPRGADQPAAADRVAVLDPATLRQRASYPLDVATTYRSLALGPRSGRLWLFGNRAGPHGQGALVATLDPASGRVLDRWVVRPASGRNWLVYRGIVTTDERHLVVSYHGTDTTGADVLTLADRRLMRCTGTPSWAGCLPSVHGDIAALGGRLLATTGDAQRVEELTLDGRMLRRWASGLAGNHLMELAVDAAARRLYAIGSCGYTGGLSVIDLDTGRARLLAAPVAGGGLAGAPPTVCGERIEAGLQGLLVVAKRGRPVPVPQSPGALLLIDPQDGRLLHTVPTPSEPVDLLLAP